MISLDTAKREICSIGDRLYKRGFAAANDGNITYRVGGGKFLCTPTMHCKGFLTPEDLCVIDAEGIQVEGAKKRSSEALLHLEIMQARPDVNCVVHCHPPHATAFAVAREAIPNGVLPEIELFLGEVPISRYETPGGKAFAETILPFVQQSSVVVLANHGTVSWGETVERAYWWTEMLDAYCRILILARQIGRVEFISEEKTRELIALKPAWGFTDPRLEGELAAPDPRGFPVFGDTWQECGVKTGAFGSPTGDAAKPQAELSREQLDYLAEQIARRLAEKMV